MTPGSPRVVRCRPMGARTRGLARRAAMTLGIVSAAACEVAHEIGEVPGDITVTSSASAMGFSTTVPVTTGADATDPTTSTQVTGDDATFGEASTVADTDTSGSTTSSSDGTAGSDDASTSFGGSSDDGTTTVGGSDGSSGTAGAGQ
jgi:hypothetical protein